MDIVGVPLDISPVLTIITVSVSVFFCKAVFVFFLVALAAAIARFSPSPISLSFHCNIAVLNF